VPVPTKACFTESASVLLRCRDPATRMRSPGRAGKAAPSPVPAPERSTGASALLHANSARAVYLRTRCRAAPLTGQAVCGGSSTGLRSLRAFGCLAHSAALAANGIVASTNKDRELRRPALVGVVGESDFTNGIADDDARHVKLPKIGLVASCSYAANSPWHATSGQRWGLPVSAGRSEG
jgi:hypothetical protein